MAALRVRRSWWVMQQAGEGPLFRALARKWRPVDRRERRVVPFQFAVPADDAVQRKSVATKPKIVVAVAEKMKKASSRTWNPWMLTK
jgi:hypothetical protein